MTSDPATRARPRWAVGLIFAAAVLMLTGYALAFAGERGAALGAWALVLGNAVLAPAAMALGAPLRGTRGSVVCGALWATGFVLFVAFAVALALPADEAAASRLFLGFPRRAAIVIYGAGVLPLLALPALFAWSFDARAFDAGNIERIRAARPVERDPAPP